MGNALVVVIVFPEGLFMFRASLLEPGWVDGGSSLPSVALSTTAANFFAVSLLFGELMLQLVLAF